MLAAAVSALAAGCAADGEPLSADAPPAESAGSSSDVPSGPAALAPVNVAVTTLEPSPLTERIELSGRLEPWVDVEVSTELGGAVEFVGFDKGHYVREGQVLARIGTDLFEAAVQEAEAALTQAEATYQKAQQLFERQAVPRQDVIDATGAFEVRKAQLVQAKLRLERSQIKAPISGRTLSREIEPGEVLSPGASITVIQRLDRLKAVVGIPETDIALFSVGGEAALEVDAYDDRTFDGRIHFIGTSATGSTRTFPADIAVANRDGALKPGMIARVSLTRRTFDDVIVVPRDALHERDAGTVAVVEEDGVARVRAVSLDANEGDRVMVTDGLRAGDRLVIEGQRGVVDGQRVRIVERAP